MTTEKIAIGRWYRCPHCCNYALYPTRCCDDMMIEVDGETDVIYQENN